jgi:hypothetical protein
MNDQVISLDDRFLTMDQCIQFIETDVAHIKMNVRTTLYNIFPEDQRYWFVIGCILLDKITFM